MGRRGTISAEPTGFEPVAECKFWPGERYFSPDGLPTQGATMVVRAAFVPDGTKYGRGDDDRPAWFDAGSASFVTSRYAHGLIIYELDLADVLTGDAAAAYRKEVTCGCCGGLWDRDSAGHRSRSVGCWFCTLYHQSPFVGSQAYRDFRPKRNGVLLTCDAYRESHAVMLLRAQPSPERDEAQAAHNAALEALRR